jgi:hypothetical protein
MWSIRDSLNCGCGGSPAPTKKLYGTSILPFSNVGYTVCVRDAHRLYWMSQPCYRGTKSSQICDDLCLTHLVWFWWQSQPHHQWVDQYNMNHPYIDAILGVRECSCWNWQVFFDMQVNWGLQTVHQILKLGVLSSDTVLNPLLIRSSSNGELNLLHLRNSEQAAPQEIIVYLIGKLNKKTNHFDIWSIWTLSYTRFEHFELNWWFFWLINVNKKIKLKKELNL